MSEEKQVSIENIIPALALFHDKLQELGVKIMAGMGKVVLEFAKILKENSENDTGIFEFFNILKDATENPDSYYNWVNYCQILSEYFWILPYSITTRELYDILEEAHTENDFDKKISKYFTKEKVESLINDIEKKLSGKYQLKFFKQIVEGYMNKLYAISSLGIISIIDGLLSYYIKDKGCNSRVNMFLPIIDKLEKTEIEKITILPLIVRMVNNNINTLYENIEFNSSIKIKTHKTSRRNPISHGKKYSYSKIDCIMLLNTLYYVVFLQEELSIFKNCLKYNRNKKEFSLISK